MPQNTCLAYYPQCTGWWTVNGNDYRRQLQAEDEEINFVVFDDIVADYETSAAGGGDRILEAALGVSEEECNELKAQLILTVLSLLSDVSTKCSNLVLGPSKLQCLIVVPPTSSPSRSPTLMPTGASL
jgi:hypothetical protein